MLTARPVSVQIIDWYFSSTDGQVIKGTEVARQGDSYLVTMAGGNTVAFPAALVREIKFEDDAPSAAAPALGNSKAKDLAGPPISPQDPSQALKVFGAPTEWSKKENIAVSFGESPAKANSRCSLPESTSNFSANKRLVIASLS